MSQCFYCRAIMDNGRCHTYGCAGNKPTLQEKTIANLRAENERLLHLLALTRPEKMYILDAEQSKALVKMQLADRDQRIAELENQIETMAALVGQPAPDAQTFTATTIDDPRAQRIADLESEVARLRRRIACLCATARRLVAERLVARIDTEHERQALQTEKGEREDAEAEVARCIKIDKDGK